MSNKNTKSKTKIKIFIYKLNIITSRGNRSLLRALLGWIGAFHVPRKLVGAGKITPTSLL